VFPPCFGRRRCVPQSFDSDEGAILQMCGEFFELFLFRGLRCAARAIFSTYLPSVFSYDAQWLKSSRLPNGALSARWVLGPLVIKSLPSFPKVPVLPSPPLLRFPFDIFDKLPSRGEPTLLRPRCVHFFTRKRAELLSFDFSRGLSPLRLPIGFSGTPPFHS